MPCDLSIKVRAIVDAYASLCDLCCDPTTDCLAQFPSNTDTMCGDGSGLISEIGAAVRAVLGASPPTGCTEMTADEYYPDPGTIAAGDCLTGEYLDDMLDWIEHIECESDPCYDFPNEDCYFVQISARVACFNGTVDWNYEGEMLYWSSSLSCVPRAEPPYEGCCTSYSDGSLTLGWSGDDPAGWRVYGPLSDSALGACSPWTPPYGLYDKIVSSNPKDATGGYSVYSNGILLYQVTVSNCA